MQRVYVYVDGYNLYHAVHDTKQFHLKWLNLRALSQLLINNVPNATVEEVYYFSAYATWKPDAYKRHRDYVRALQTENVKIILGNFKKKPKHCRRCGATWLGHEEKETDVNIALRLLQDASEDAFDQALVISADTDLSTAIRFVKEKFPHKHITAVFPPGRQIVAALINAADDHVRISTDMLQRCLFPKNVGAVTRPISYDP